MRVRSIIQHVAALACLATGPLDTQAVAGGSLVSADEMRARGIVGLKSQSSGVRCGSCTGTLVAPDLVLTARHCLDQGEDGPLKEVIFGSTDLFRATEESQQRRVVSVRAAPGPEADLALVKFDGSAPADYTIDRLVTSLGSTIEGSEGVEEVFTFGFGQQQEESLAGAGVLRSLTDSVILDGVEKDAPLVTVLPADNAKGMCVGDSGGPAFVKAEDISGFSADAKTAQWQSAHPKNAPFAQVGVLSTIGGPECEGGSSEYVSVAAYGRWLKEAAKELGSPLEREVAAR